MATVVKISINEDVEPVIGRLRAHYPTMSAAELFKLGLAELDRKRELETRQAWIDSLPVLELSDEEAASLAEALDEGYANESKTMTAEEVIAMALELE